MKRIRNLLFIAMSSICAGGAFAAVSDEEAAQLGKSLTLFGAEAAGNKEGTIPPYTGGLTKAPADYKPGSGIYTDPFNDEKPLFSITAKNVAQYADKLSEGQKALFVKYPDYRMDVYPTHRTAAFTKDVLENTVKNATRAKTTADGIGLEGAEGGIPFPIPKTGYEVMFNRLLRPNPEVAQVQQICAYVDQQGNRILACDINTRLEMPYYQASSPDRKNYMLLYYCSVTNPAAIAGNQYLFKSPLNYADQELQVYSYIPGQRRVKRAPELAYDTPMTGSAGMVLNDDLYLFNGRMDRFDFKLIGKKEMFIPYNNYRFHSAGQGKTNDEAMAAVLNDHFVKPEVIRWELHRVWEVEAKLKEGKRHLYSKRVYYFDEDAYASALVDLYDNAGKLLRSGIGPSIQLYDRTVPISYYYSFTDWSSGNYIVAGLPTGPQKAGLTGPGAAAVWKASEWTPEGMAARGVR